MQDSEPLPIQNLPQKKGLLKPIETKEDTFKNTIGQTKAAMNALSTFAIQNGVDASNFNHIDQVFTDNSHVLFLPIKTLRKELAKIEGGETNETRRTRALKSQKTGEIFIPEELVGSLHDVLHESIHRAAWVRDRQEGIPINQTQLARQVAARYKITITDDGKIDPNSEYIRTYAANENEKTMLVKHFNEGLKIDLEQVAEGLTEWTTQRASGISLADGTKVALSQEDYSYPEYVRNVERARAKLIKDKNIGPERADAKIIAAALTGDASEIISYLIDFN